MRTQKAACRNTARGGARPLPAQACPDGGLKSDSYLGIENGSVSVGLDLLCRIVGNLDVQTYDLIAF